MIRFIIILGFILTTIYGCADDKQETITANVNGHRIIAADKEPGNWMSHGRTYSEQRFSPLVQINTQNVDQLGLAWFNTMETTNGLEVTPLVVDGVMYTTSNWNMVHALDAKTGKELWRYDPHTRRDWIRNSCCGPINRGVAVWKGKVYEATIDGRLVAVNAADGKLIWEVQTTDPNQPYSITGAPRVANDKVVIGNSGAEFGIRGYVTAYDATTGDQVWRFYTVPGDPAKGFESAAMEMAAKTWSGEWWKFGGGGNAWDSFSFDPELNLLYIGTGNGGPWPRDMRSPGGGDNLFLCSIVAVNADTGEYVWHYQTTPGENWDYNSAQQMILADIEIDNVTRKVLIQAPKNGFFYVLDRETGELISAKNFVPVTWASHIDPVTVRPVEITENLYNEQIKIITPGPNGGHDWQPMSYNPQTGLVYLPINEMSWPYSRSPDWEWKKWAWNIGYNPDAEMPPEIKDTVSRGALLAWDPVKQEKVWEVDLGGPWNGGVLTTAGKLVIEGAADGRFVIYHADTGKVLWQMPIYTGAVAGPVTYTVDGEQYIAVAAGWGGAMVLMGNGIADIFRAPSRMLAFKLGGTAKLPPPPPPPPMPDPPQATASTDTVKQGGKLYARYCGSCHGFNVISGGTMPDLRYMTEQTHDDFMNIVYGGARLAKGMSGFADLLSENEIRSIHDYIISRANVAWHDINNSDRPGP